MTEHYFYFSQFFFLKKDIWLLLKTRMKTRASFGGGAMSVCWIVSECLTPIDLTRTSWKEKEKKAPVEYVFYLNTVNHACTLLEYFKVLLHVVNEAKSVQPICGNWLRHDFVPKRLYCLWHWKRKENLWKKRPPTFTGNVVPELLGSGRRSLWTLEVPG